MKIQLIATAILAGALALGPTLGTPANADSTATATGDESRASSAVVTIAPNVGSVTDATMGDSRKPCDYVHGAQCVSWVTNYYTCHNIFQITSDARKHRACTLFYNQGIVTVWP
ncbi:hypothetical protein KXS11_08325 [Plantibacter flavus]|uniref:hypothetical protein n=1 Tax=Plantibacter flavus TaxID=150123 RepID=UPI003F149003